MPEQQKKTTPANAKPKEAYRVFVSSTYTDMQKYREAIRNALNKADCVAYGMERFPASSVSPLDTCYEELRECQIYVCAIGMRYGTVDEATGKSYTQLEYEKAESLGIPILAFLMNSQKIALYQGEYDIGETAERLSNFKDKIQDSKTITCAYFDSASDLEGKVYQAVTNEIERQKKRADNKANHATFEDGAKLFSRFVKRPFIFKDQQAVLRIRLDGLYGGWRLRDEIFEPYGFRPGTALFINDVYVLGLKPDVDETSWIVDCFADGKAADWLENNDVSQGAIIEGRFRFAYEQIPDVASTPSGEDIDAFIAKLVLLEGMSVISRDVTVNATDQDSASRLKYTIQI